MNYHSIRFRLNVYFLILIIFPVIVTVSVTYLVSYNIISNKIKESIYNNIGQVEINIDNSLESSEGVLNIFILDNDLKLMLGRSIQVDSPKDFDQISQVEGMLSDLVNSSNSINSIYVYDIKSNILITSTGNALENSDFSSSKIYQESVKKGRLGEWLTNTDDTHGQFAMQGGNLVTYVMPIKIYEEGTTVGYVFINVSENTLYQYIGGVKFNGSGEMLIASAKGEILSYKDKSYLGKEKMPRFDFKSISSEAKNGLPVKISAGNTLVYMDQSPTSGLYYFALVPIGAINDEILIMRNIILLVSALTLVIAFVISEFFTKSIYVPINRLSTAMKKLVFKSDFDYSIKERRLDEFGALYGSFNEMVVGIRHLFDQLFEEKLKKKEAQLKLLQAQINPHFLYNTLNSIYYISKLHGINEITELSYSLTNFFRIALNSEQEFITVREMLDQINYYIRIQNIRYKDQLELITDVDQELLESSILKLLLQPLVENSILHGMKNDKRKCRIEITGYTVNDCIKFTVSDNGAGIPAMELEKIQKTFSQNNDEQEGKDMFALRNIHRRIKLHYGENYGLRIFSTEGEGTVVEVILPNTSRGDNG